LHDGEDFTFAVTDVVNAFENRFDHLDDLVGFLFDFLSMHRHSAQRNVHDLVKRQNLIEAAYLRELVKRRRQYGGIDGAAVKSRVAVRTAADLQENHILLRVHSVLSQDHDRFAVGCATEAADAELLALQIFHALYVRPRDEVMIGALYHSH